MVNSGGGRQPLPHSVAVARNWSYLDQESPKGLLCPRLSHPPDCRGTAVFFEVVRAGWVACF
jgi:hypothetical protein